MTNCMFFFSHSDRFQEYKQKHLERKVAAAKELGIKLITGSAITDLINAREGTSNKETGSWKEGQDGRNKAEENGGDNQEQQPVEDESKSGASVSAEEKAGEQSKDEGESGSDAAAVDLKKGKNDSETEEHGAMNGAVDSPVSPSSPKSKMTWADVVGSKAVNGTGSKAVNGVDSVSVSGEAKE